MFGFLPPMQPNNGAPNGAPKLPLDIVSMIINYVSSPGDLSRLSRTSRIIHYLVTPLLYKEVTLRAGTAIDSQGGNYERGLGAQAVERVNIDGGRKRKRDDHEEFCYDQGILADSANKSGNSRRGPSGFLCGLATLQRPTISKVVRKLAMEGELEMVASPESATLSQNGDNIPLVEWTESDGMVALGVGGVTTALTELEDFSWKIRNANIHPILYYSFVRHPKLNKLTIAWPSIPIRRPTCLLPVFQNLQSLTVMEIDGDRPPDDFSRVVIGGLNLKELKLGWVDGGYEKQQLKDGGGLALIFSAAVRAITAGRFLTPPATYNESPMRAQQTLSIRKLTLKKLSLLNLYLPAGDDTIDHIFDTTTIESFNTINCSIEASWSIFSPPSAPSTKPSPVTSTPCSSSSRTPTTSAPPHPLSSLKTFRTDSLSPSTVTLLNSFSGLESLYLITPTSTSPLIPTPPPLRNRFVDAITTRHGSTLHRLLLPSTFVLDQSDSSKIIRTCQGLVELGITSEAAQMPVVALLVPFLKNLRVFNLLPQPPPLSPQNAPLYDSGSMASVGNASASSPQAQLDSSSMITPTEVERLERRLGKEDFYSVRILGVGNCFWRISAVVRWEKKVRLYRNQIFLEPPNTGPHEPWCPMEEDEKAEELAEYQRDTSDPLGLAMGERGKVQKRKIQRVYDRDELSDYGIIREAVWGLSY